MVKISPEYSPATSPVVVATTLSDINVLNESLIKNSSRQKTPKTMLITRAVILSAFSVLPSVQKNDRNNPVATENSSTAKKRLTVKFSFVQKCRSSSSYTQTKSKNIHGAILLTFIFFKNSFIKFPHRNYSDEYNYILCIFFCQSIE